ncbi:MAG: phosphonate ABC transporter, permease protein PhnE [Spirochaetales bacterium]|nr:phosphonate ABC transporter, permease protein PhnE [Spirochaetales bacterium]
MNLHDSTGEHRKGLLKTTQPPPRFTRGQTLGWFVLVFAAALIGWSWRAVDFSVYELFRGLPDMHRILSEMVPPDFSRLPFILVAVLETFQMALLGAFLGILISFVLGILGAKNLSPGRGTYVLARSFISLCRTVPDLVWAVFFVASVGLGPFAGTLTIMVDTIGFCGRFFAEAMEEVDPEPQTALKAMGAGKISVMFAAVLPAAAPSFINSSLFSLEKAVRSSVVLGLVGAGGVGIELKVAMDMFSYPQAATIILLIFILVLLVERLSSLARKKYLSQETNAKES